MNIFKKNKGVSSDDVVTDDSNNTSSNSIHQVDSDTIQAKDDVPTVNSADRDVGNSNKFKIMLAVVVGLLIMLAGFAMAMGRYQQSKKEAKAQEAEEVAQAQKTLKTANKQDIESEKQEIKDQMLPPPISAYDDVGADDLTDENMISIQNEPINPPQPKPIYKDYSNTNQSATENMTMLHQLICKKHQAIPLKAQLMSQ